MPEVRWTLRRSMRSRRLSVTVQRNGGVVVTAPPFVAHNVIERFVIEQGDWIRRMVSRMAVHRDDVFLPRGRRQYLAHKEAARSLVAKHLAAYGPVVGFPYKRVSIKDMTRNWGSCSQKGNLNFNYKLLFLPEHLAAYVVIHELCHLRHFNHSRDFWSVVAVHLPHHKALRKELRRYHA